MTHPTSVRTGAASHADGERWKKWGPYLSERQWGTVREDYSPHGNAWDYFPHDHARSRAYRWGEDGIAGFSDDQQRLVLGAGAVERARPDPQGAAVRTDQRRRQPRRGRQGALLLPRRDADALVPEDALQVSAGASIPYAGLVEENRRRGIGQPEFELIDTVLFDDDRYFDVFVEYAQADAGRHADAHHRFTTADPRPPRSTCCRSSGSATPGAGSPTRHAPSLRMAAAGVIEAEHPELGAYHLHADGDAERRYCSATTSRTRSVSGTQLDTQRLLQGRVPRSRRARSTSTPSIPRNRHQGRGLVSSSRFPQADSIQIRLRLTRDMLRRGHSATSTSSSRARIREADEFYAHLQQGMPNADARARAAPGLRRDDLEQAVLLLRRRRVARRAIRPSLRRPPAASTAATASGRI